MCEVRPLQRQDGVHTCARGQRFMHARHGAQGQLPDVNDCASGLSIEIMGSDLQILHA